MSKVVDLSDLPEELVDLIANRLFSNVELLRIRSICKSWRSAVATNNRIPNRNLGRFLSPYINEKPCLLSPAAFFRVILSSCPNEGWLIKTQDVFGRKQLLSPLSRLSIDPSDQTLDLLKFTVSEIHQSYDVQHSEKSSYNFVRVVPVVNVVFIVNCNKQIWCCNSEENSNHVWTRILDEEAGYFSDIIVHRGQIYALDLKGAIWWISLSELSIYQFGPSTPMDYYYDVDSPKDRKLVEYCGDVCIVHRFCKRFRIKRVDIEMTVGFRVYKIDDELVEWVEIKSLGDKAIVMATDTCFSVLAREYRGCLENSIYFMDKEIVKVFKLGDGSITAMVDSSHHPSCFQMFSPPFVV